MQNCVAVVGCGRWGNRLASTFKRLGALHSVCDLSPARAQEASSLYGAASASWQRILSDEAVLAVVIAVPSKLHAQMALEALSGGKDVFVEKPMAFSLTQANELMKAARNGSRQGRGGGLVLMTGHIMRFHPAFLRMKELLGEGAIGQVHAFFATRASWGRVHGQKSVHDSEDDALLDLMPHDISMLLGLMGGARPQGVQAWASQCLFSDSTDHCLARLSFANAPNGPVHAFLEASWLGPEKMRQFKVLGDKGTLVLDDARPWEEKLFLYKHRAFPARAVFAPEAGEAVPLVATEPLEQECMAFMKAVLGHEAPAEDGSEGLGVLSVLEGIRKAAGLPLEKASSSDQEPKKDEAGGLKDIPLIDLPGQQERIRPFIDKAIGRVLDHGQYILGPEVDQLERELEAYCSVKHAITCSDGTSAIVLALMVLGVGPGDAVLVPSFTFVATAEAVVLVGAVPVFVDVLEGTYNIDASGIPKATQAARAAGLKPVGVVTVDIFGQPADYGALFQASDSEGLWIVADAAQSFGASYRGVKVGSHGCITATSFFPSKPLGCYGDGGALFTNDDAYAKKLRSLRNHGADAHQYDNTLVGMNGRLDSIQAAILLEKLKLFDEEMEKRTVIAGAYQSGLASCGHLGLPEIIEGATSCWSLYTVRAPGYTGGRTKLAQKLKEAGIATRIYYQTPVHLQTAYAPYFHQISGGQSLPVSEKLAKCVLSLPLSVSMTEADISRVVSALR